MKRKLLMFIAIYVAICAWLVPIQAQSTDVTENYITNPSFEGPHEVFARPNSDRTIDKPEGWEVTYQGGDGNDFGNVAESFNQDGVIWNAKSGNAYFIRQRWSNNSTIGLSQELRELPAGIYELKASIANHVESGKTSTAKIYATVAGETYQTFAKATSAAQENWDNYSVIFEVSEKGDVIIGLSSNHGEGTFKTAYDDFTLTYSSSWDNYLEGVIAGAEELINTAKAQASVLTALSETIEEAKDLVQDGTVESYLVAVEKIKETMKIVNESIATYVTLEDAIASANANKENYADLSGYDAFVAAIATAQGVYDEATANETEIADAITALASAERTCRLTQTAPADFTFAIVNPDANDGNNGWTITGKMNNPRPDEHWLGKDAANPYFDGGNWEGTGWTTTMSQEINGLPAGKYVLKAVARASEGVTLSLIAKAGTQVDQTTCPSVGSTAGAIWENAEEGSVEKGINEGKGYGWAHNNVSFELLQGETLTIRFEATTEGKHEWFSVDQFELEYESLGTITEPTAPELPEITATPVAPTSSNSYAIYHPASKKLLSSTESGNDPRLNDFGIILGEDGYSTNLDAYTWTYNEITDDNGFYLQQVFADKYLNASTTSSDYWSVLLGDLDTSNASRWTLAEVENGYRISSTRSPEQYIGVDNITGNNIHIYFNKSVDHNPLFQFITLEDLMSPEIQAYDEAMTAYRKAMVIYNKKQVLLKVLTSANEIVTSRPAEYSQEATQAYEDAMNAAKAVYLNTEADLAEVEAAIPSLTKALNTYILSAIEASDENPADITDLIFNSDFSTSDVSLWNGAVGAVGSGIYEMYQKSDFNMNQILEGLPVGYYELTVQGFAREKGNDSGAAYASGTENIVAYLYAEAGEVISENKMQSLYSETETGSLNGYANSMAEANAAFEAGKYSDNAVEIFLEEGDNLTIGVKYKGAYVGASWTTYDNFKLIYKGNTIATLVKEVESIIETAEEVAEGYMQNSVSETLAESISAAKTVVQKEEPTKEELNEVKEALENAIEGAQSSIAAYSKLNSSIEAVAETSVAENTKVVAAVATATGLYNDKNIDEEGIEEAIVALKTVVNEAIVEDAVDGNVTELIVNPTIIQENSKTIAPKGWEDSMNEGTNGNFTKDSGTTDEPKDTFLEAWNGNVSTIVFDYNQTLQNIPNGIYSLSAATFTETKNNNAVLYANEVTAPMASDVNGDSFKNEGVEPTSLVVTVTDGTLTIGIKTIGTLDGSWHGADDFVLTFIKDINTLKQELNDSLEVATALKADQAALIVKAEMNKLDAAIETGNAAKDSNETEEVFDAIQDLKSAILAARTSIELCSELIPLFTEATELVTQYGETIDATDLQTVLDNSYDLYQNQDDDTDNALIASTKAELEAAIEAYKIEVKTIGVNDINADNVKVYVNGSTIIVDGADYVIYTQSGIRMTTNSQLLPGIYIVKVAGKTVKVAVK